jgi:tetratricopeptide (TPR) repeat protein
LSLAAAYLEEGVERNAVPHLAIYMRAVPEHVAVRVHYAEILFHLQMFQESRTQFEQCIAHAQDRVEIAPTLHIEIHSKLMEIAEILEDDYAEHLERGIGLYLLAGERSRLADPDGKLSVEGLLCRAVGELKEASSQRPKEARPQWYLYLTSIRLGQRPQAERALRETERRAKFSELTPCEEDELELTRRKADTSAKHR